MNPNWNGDWPSWKGYTNAELIAAVNQTSTIPPLNTSQLLQVIYHCQDINGNIVGNSFCEEGCLANSQATQDDQCKLSGTTTTVTVTTTAPISCYKKCQTICFGGGCGIFQETTVPNTQTMTPLLTFWWAFNLFYALSMKQWGAHHGAITCPIQEDWFFCLRIILARSYSLYLSRIHKGIIRNKKFWLYA